jgi:4-aminobutyrate---pyruvate transaminase
VIEHVAAVAPMFQQRLRQFAEHRLVGNVRGIGLMGAVEMVADKTTRRAFDPPGRAGGLPVERCQEHGLIVRGIGDAAAFCPPLIIERYEFGTMFERFACALDETAGMLLA